MKSDHIKLKFAFGTERENESCAFIVKMMPWLLEQGYPRKIIRLPKGINQKSDSTSIAKAVSRDYTEDTYVSKIKIIEKAWHTTAAGFEKLGQARGVKLFSSYGIKLTKYGTGGSYNTKRRTVTLLVEGKDRRELLCTLVHEMVHIGIQHLVERYKITHWRKERLVDLLVAKNFPKLKLMQKTREDSLVVDRAFKNHYPNVSRIAKAIGA